MENDVLFKSRVFGGFDKKTVMDYISSLLSEKSGLEESLAKAKKDAADLYSQATSLEARLGAAEAGKAQAEELKELVSRLEASNEALASRLELVSEQYSTASEKITQLEKENSGLIEDSRRLREAQSQLGAAMIDARLYSDKLVEEATQRVNGINLDAYAAIGDTASLITSLSAEVSTISSTLVGALGNIDAKINELAQSMKLAATALVGTDEKPADASKNPASAASANPSQAYEPFSSAPSEPEASYAKATLSHPVYISNTDLSAKSSEPHGHTEEDSAESSDPVFLPPESDEDSGTGSVYLFG